MVIEWNKSTWYSKIAAIVVFVGFMPTVTFVIGKEYQQTKIVLAEAQEAAESVESEASSIDLFKDVQEMEQSGECKTKAPACPLPTTPDCDQGLWSCIAPKRAN